MSGVSTFCRSLYWLTCQCALEKKHTVDETAILAEEQTSNYIWTKQIKKRGRQIRSVPSNTPGK